MNWLIYHLYAIGSAFMSVRWALLGIARPAIAGPGATWVGHSKWQRPEIIANSGGPRSRVVATPIVSRMLSQGSETLGLRPLGHYEMSPRHEPGGFRNLAMLLLRKAGFNSPDQAWDSMRDQVPDQPALVIDTPSDAPPDSISDSSADNRKAALVLGKCCGALFSPERPVIWSERRLARSVRLVQCDAETFTRSDDE